MKMRLLLLAFVTFSFIGLLRADFKPDFSAPPYVLNQTVLKVDGWEDRLPTEEDTTETARLAPVSWNQDKPAIVLERSSLKNISFPPAKSDRVSIAFSVAVDVLGQVQPGRQFRIFFTGAPIGEVYYDADPEQGFGYHGVNDGRTGGTVCIPSADVVNNSYYTFLFDLNAATQTYDISVTGKKADGTPLAFKAENIPFLSPLKGDLSVNGVHLLSGPWLNVYLGSLAIEAK